MLSEEAIEAKQNVILDLLNEWKYSLELKTAEQIIFHVPFGRGNITEKQLQTLEQYGELVNHPIQGGIQTIEVLLQDG